MNYSLCTDVTGERLYFFIKRFGKQTGCPVSVPNLGTIILKGLFDASVFSLEIVSCFTYGISPRKIKADSHFFWSQLL